MSKFDINQPQRFVVQADGARIEQVVIPQPDRFILHCYVSGDLERYRAIFRQMDRIPEMVVYDADPRPFDQFVFVNGELTLHAVCTNDIAVATLVGKEDA